jgi:hypothetical protein
LDLTNILIFVAVFVGFLIVVRRLFSSEETYTTADLVHRSREERGSEQPLTPALTGADIAFPVKVPEVEYLGRGNYNRPIIKNYYFAKIDLVRGPERSDSFCDDLFLQLEDPGSGFNWENQYMVATPAGLQEKLKSEPTNAVLLVGTILIVPRWDLALIRKEIMDDILEKHEIANSEPDDDQQATS